jgi:pyrimidine operon attenuation protein/uracil phosphoribosyltransferase
MISTRGYTQHISVRILFPPFFPDGRGNRLESYAIRSVRDSVEKRLYLCGPSEVALQVQWIAPCMPLSLTDEQSHEWTHRFSYATGVPANVTQTLDLFKQVLVLCVPAPIDAAIALDWYKNPDSHEDPMKWEDTYAGSLVYRGKYRGDLDAREELAERMTEVISTHPTYDSADYILSVPGHDQTSVSFGERLAMRVADLAGKPLLTVKATSLVRDAAKAREPGTTLEEEFVVGNEVAGRVVVVVDDVWGHGDTMRAIAEKAKEQGARAVLGVVGARRMRS